LLWERKLNSSCFIIFFLLYLFHIFSMNCLTKMFFFISVTILTEGVSYCIQIVPCLSQMYIAVQCSVTLFLQVIPQISLHLRTTPFTVWRKLRNIVNYVIEVTKRRTHLVHPIHQQRSVSFFFLNCVCFIKTRVSVNKYTKWYAISKLCAF